MHSTRVSTRDRFGLVFLRRPGADDLDAYYAALRTAAPILRGEAWRRAVTGYYVNCARDNALRISYFTREAELARRVAEDFVADGALRYVTAPEPPASIEVSANYGGEELRFRRFLVTYAPVVLDLMLADLLHARRLIATLRFQVTRSRGDPRAHLESTCLEQSPCYRGLGAEDRTRFWRDLGHWPNPPRVDWAHMLVNMVLGFDWPPADFLTPAPALGSAEINGLLAACQGDLTIPLDWSPAPSARRVRVRRGATRDAERIAALGAQAFEAAFGADNRPEDMQAYIADNFNRDRIAGELADPAAIFLLAEDGDEVAGYAMLRDGKRPAPLARERAVELVRIYAAPGRTGRGYGSGLMEACLAEARRAGHESVWLGVWERNRGAIDFYRRWRFTVVGTHEFVLGSDVQNDLIMARRLDPHEPA